MKIKTMAAAALLALGSAGVWAQSLSWTETLVADPGSPGAYSINFNRTHKLAGEFTDTIAFVKASASTFAYAIAADGHVATQGFVPTLNINFSDASASFNGEPYAHTQWMSGAREKLSLAQRLVPAGTPLVLTISGLAGAGLAPGSSINATYSGTLNVTAVPEPATYALLLAGLAVVGLAARHRTA